MPVTNSTANRGYQLPNASNKLNEDVLRLIAALQAIDTDVAAALSSLAGKAATGHAHVINDVSGLQDALNAKMNASVSLALAGLSDVDLSGASAGMFLRLTGSKWSPATFDAGMIASGTISTSRLPSYLAAAMLAQNYAPIAHGHAASDIAGLPAPSGTRMLFQQSTAPTGWTKDTTHNDKALRIVSGAVGSGGSSPFTSVFTSRTPAGSVSSTTTSGSVGSTTLAESQIPSHLHGTYYRGSTGTGTIYDAPRTGVNAYADGQAVNIQATGGSGSHSHSLTMNAHNHAFSGSAMDFAVQYVDLIIAAKD